MVPRQIFAHLLIEQPKRTPQELLAILRDVLLTVRLDPGCGEKLVLTMKRYANRPTVLHPWQRPQTR